MMCTRSQNDTNMVVGKHGIQTIEVVVVVLLFLWLSFDVLVPTSAHPLLSFEQLRSERFAYLSKTNRIGDIKCNI
jgi:hypothetical protein